MISFSETFTSPAQRQQLVHRSQKYLGGFVLFAASIEQISPAGKKEARKLFMKAGWNHRMEAVVLAGYLLENSKKNILRRLASSETVARVDDSERELVEAGAWAKLQGRNLFFIQTRLGTRATIRS